MDSHQGFTQDNCVDSYFASRWTVPLSLPGKLNTPPLWRCNFFSVSEQRVFFLPVRKKGTYVRRVIRISSYKNYISLYSWIYSFSLIFVSRRIYHCMTMADDNFFLIFSEAEAPDPLRLSLQYFFEKEQYSYKFSNAFTKFTKISNEELITARRFFNIVKETSLISDKLVIRHHTTSGWTYSFEKGFFRNAERYHRRINRVGNDLILHTIDDAVEETKSTTFSQKSTNTPTSLPITQDDTSSIENLSVADTWEQTNTITAHSRRDSSPTSPLSNSANNTTVDVSMKSEIRNITDTMNDDINKVMADLQDSPQSFTRPLQSTIREFITNEIANSFTNLTGFKTASDITTKLDQVTVLERDLRIRKENFNQVEIQYKKSIEKMESRFHFLTNKVDKFESQLQNKLDTVTSQTTQLVDSKRDETLRKMDESMRLMNTKVGIITSDLDSISATRRSGNSLEFPDLQKLFWS